MVERLGIYRRLVSSGSYIRIIIREPGNCDTLTYELAN
jgi:hypothetical protein